MHVENVTLDIPRGNNVYNATLIIPSGNNVDSTLSYQRGCNGQLTKWNVRGNQVDPRVSFHVETTLKMPR